MNTDTVIKYIENSLINAVPFLLQCPFINSGIRDPTNGIE